MKKFKSKTVFAVCFLAYTSIYIARLNLSMASPALIEDNLMTASNIGILGSVFSVVYAVGRLINGMLGDKTPPWLMLSLGLAFAGVSNLAIGFLPPFSAVLLLWSINAYAQSMLWSSVLCAVSAIYDEKTAKKRMPYMVSAVAIGNILGILIGSFVIEKFGVGYAFTVPGVITAVFALLVLVVTRSIPAQKKSDDGHIPYFELLKNRKVQRMTAPAMLHGVMKDNISLWMTVFFVSAYGIELKSSAWYVLAVPAVGLLGRLLYPLCYKVAGENEDKVSRAGFLLCIASAVPLCIKGIPPVLSAVCLAVLYAAVSLINTSVLSIFPLSFMESGNVASVGGMMDFFTYLGAGIGSLIYGFAIDGGGFSPVFLSWAGVSLASYFVLICGKGKRHTF